jgi:hypothetical protein
LSSLLWLWTGGLSLVPSSGNVPAIDAGTVEALFEAPVVTRLRWSPGTRHPREYHRIAEPVHRADLAVRILN